MKVLEFARCTKEEVQARLDRAKERLEPEDYEFFEGITLSTQELLQLIVKKKISIKRLRQIIFGSKSEKTDKVLKGSKDGEDEAQAQGTGEPFDEAREPQEEKKKRKGHGRHGARDYPDAERIALPRPETGREDLLSGKYPIFFGIGGIDTFFDAVL